MRSALQDILAASVGIALAIRSEAALLIAKKPNDLAKHIQVLLLMRGFSHGIIYSKISKDYDKFRAGVF